MDKPIDATHPNRPDDWPRDEKRRDEKPHDIAGMLAKAGERGWYVDLNGPIHDDWFARVTLASTEPGKPDRPTATAYDKRPDDALRRALDDFEAAFTPTPEPAMAGAT